MKDRRDEISKELGIVIDKNPPPLVWTGPIPGCTCGGIDIERRECQGYKTCKCGKTIFNSYGD